VAPEVFSTLVKTPWCLIVSVMRCLSASPTMHNDATYSCPLNAFGLCYRHYSVLYIVFGVLCYGGAASGGAEASGTTTGWTGEEQMRPSNR
jgi:hypothetical protein